MRPHGHARISSKHPEALGICYRCGSVYNRNELKWQFDWKMGPRLFNQGSIVCESCYDKPQESGRPIVLPPDPETVDYASPDFYVQADNPVSPLNFDVSALFTPLAQQSLGGNIGNMTLNAGVNAAFDGVTNKPAGQCAALSVSNSSYQNTIGKNWNAYPSGITLTMPSTAGSVSHVLSSFTLYAPNDQRFLNSATGITGYKVDGSNNSVTWTTLYSGTTTGAIGETITGNTTSGAAYVYHRVNFEGDGISAIAVAQVQFSISDAAPNDI